MEQNDQGEDLDGVSKSIEDFTINFYKKIAEKIKGNFVSSAISAHVALSMAAYGAEGTTKEQMRQSLRLPASDLLVQQEFQKIIDTLNAVEVVALKVANKIYTSDSIKIKEQFKEITCNYFRSESSTLDFSDKVNSAKEINKWCFEQTNGKIRDIIRPDELNADTAMLLLNAMYFKGSWKHVFSESSTESKPFYMNKTAIIDVPTMTIKKNFFFTELKDLNAEIVGLPYKNEDFRMLIIIPTEIDGLQNLEKNLENIKLDFDRISIRLSLPKFKVETSIHLNSHLHELGMVEMFTNKANFNGITNNSIKVDKVIQKAFVEVNEEGTEAAVVDAFRCKLMKRERRPRNVIVDRPFLYKIMHKDCTLFMGRVVNPLES